MKNYHILLIGIAFLAVACKKTETQNNESLPAPQTSEQAAVSSQWATPGNWKTTTGKSSTSHETNITDANITKDVMSNGLVLVYINNGKTIEALPFEQTDGTNWYYQVTGGTITIGAESKAGTKSLSDASVRYFVFSSGQLADLQTKGYSREALMQLDYIEAEQLLRK